MLRELHIENIAVIEKLDVSFGPGFTVLTGETGAGKSILIDSIGMILGSRTSRDLVRTGCEKAFACATFDNNEALKRELAGVGIDADDDVVIVSRELTVEGRSSARINGRSVTGSVLRQIGTSLINIHGQHDNILLLDPTKHLPFLDEFARDGETVSGYREAYDKALDALRRIKALSLDDSDKQERIDLLRYQINEIESAGLDPDEEQQLQQRRIVLMNKEKITDRVNLAYEHLRDGEKNARDLVSDAAVAVGDSVRYDPELEGINSKLNDILSELDDVTAELYDYKENEDFSEEELNSVEQRLGLIHKFKRKYGEDIPAMLEYLEKAKTELEQIEFSGEELEKLRQQYAVLKADMLKKASALSSVRHKAAEELEKLICGELAFLDMPKVVFKVSFSEKRPEPDGMDVVEFLISANVGQEPKPLGKIASGGELSRIMLAVRNILNRDDAQTLIFDEIDTGVSGQAAQKIAIKLRQMSETVQVIVVTHLAQIASYADTHFRISKDSDALHTYTKLTKLDLDGRAQELARIMGGNDISETMLRTAREMLINNSK